MIKIKDITVLMIMTLLIPQIAISEEQKSGLKSALNSSSNNEPVLIKSDTLNLDSKERIFTYRGNVHVVKGDLDITSDILVGKYSEKQELENILCRGNVVITRGPEMRATSNRAFYNVKAAKIDMTEEPELNRGGNVLAADKIIIYVDEDKSEAEGNVRVKVIKNEGSGSALGKSVKSKMNDQTKR